LDDLTENLGLAKNHRIQTRGDTAQVPDRLAPEVLIRVVRDVPWIQLAGLGQNRHQRRRVPVLTDQRVQLDTVARGEPCQLADRFAVTVRCGRVARNSPFAQRAQVTPQLFAVRNGRSPVVDTDADNPVVGHSGTECSG
jgi:hypothetical protein